VGTLQLQGLATQAASQLMRRVEVLVYAIGFAFLAGVVPQGQVDAAQRRKVVDDDYFDKLAR
jgi:hypothetical protein